MDIGKNEALHSHVDIWQICSVDPVLVLFSSKALLRKYPTVDAFASNTTNAIHACLFSNRRVRLRHTMAKDLRSGSTSMLCIARKAFSTIIMPKVHQKSSHSDASRKFWTAWGTRSTRYGNTSKQPPSPKGSKSKTTAGKAKGKTESSKPSKTEAISHKSSLFR